MGCDDNKLDIFCLGCEKKSTLLCPLEAKPGSRGATAFKQGQCVACKLEAKADRKRT